MDNGRDEIFEQEEDRACNESWLAGDESKGREDNESYTLKKPGGELTTSGKQERYMNRGWSQRFPDASVVNVVHFLR